MSKHINDIDVDINTLQDPELSETAITILEARYLRKDENGKIIETPKELFYRVAKAIALTELKYKSRDPINKIVQDKLKTFYDMMVSLEFIPNSPTLMNAGLPNGQLAACFVLGIEDDTNNIFDTLKNTVSIFRSGGGVGFNFSKIRPAGSLVKTTGGEASGPISFMNVYNETTEQIKQGGKRRGGAMGILDIDHPDIEKFIECKDQEGVLNNFNISVAISDKFMDAVNNDSDFELINPHNKSVAKVVKAKQLFQSIVDHAHKTGDPGVIFMDTVNKFNPNTDEKIEASNPCSEIFLLSGECCTLGSINLHKFIKNNGLDWDRLQTAIYNGVEFLDNVLDTSVFPLEYIDKRVKENRKIGLGIMGFADVLMEFGISYGSKECEEFIDKLMSFFNRHSFDASLALGAIRGAFPRVENSIYNLSKSDHFKKNKDHYKYLKLATNSKMFSIRNATRTTVAPTGTLSMFADCSSGMEPAFALAYIKRVLDGTDFIYVNKIFSKKLTTYLKEKYPIDWQKYYDKITNYVATTGKLSGNEEIANILDKKFIDTFKTAQELTYEEHIRMQATFQKYIDNAISKTINMTNDATKEDVYNAYMLAYNLGCKGVTIYRDGCKSSQVLYTGSTDKKQDESDTTQVDKTPIEQESKVLKRPDTLTGFTSKMQTGLGVLYLTVNELNGQPFEVFATIGKSGNSVMAKAESIGRLVSLCLRTGVEVKEIVTQLKGIGGEHPVFQKKSMVLSIPDAIARVLEEHYLQDTKAVNKVQDLSNKNNSCPECGATLTIQEGCCLCPSCGYSKCGG